MINPSIEDAGCSWRRRIVLKVVAGWRRSGAGHADLDIRGVGFEIAARSSSDFNDYKFPAFILRFS
jgi:hypothetical protein